MADEDWQVLGEPTAGEIALNELAELKNEVAQLRGEVVAKEHDAAQLRSEVALLTARLATAEQDATDRMQSLHDEIAWCVFSLTPPCVYFLVQILPGS